MYSGHALCHNGAEETQANAFEAGFTNLQPLGGAL